MSIDACATNAYAGGQRGDEPAVVVGGGAQEQPRACLMPSFCASGVPEYPLVMVAPRTLPQGL